MALRQTGRRGDQINTADRQGDGPQANEGGSVRAAYCRTDWGTASSRVTPARGGLSAETEVKALSRKEMGLRAREVWRKES